MHAIGKVGSAKDVTIFTRSYTKNKKHTPVHELWTPLGYACRKQLLDQASQQTDNPLTTNNFPAKQQTKFKHTRATQTAAFN